ncbi:hypothetical protein WBP07_01865 [Novosphingobium sp. BL-8A]|uniref:hypothetical protein n=1 Tax=Novosphingobium sp. BL-8A TaxID=3127639 RepID=UPI003757738B
MKARRAGVIGILGLPALLLAGEAAARDVATPTAQDFATQTAVIDDPSQPHVLASTHAVAKRGHGWAASRSVEVGPAHLRAHVDRETGTVRWQLWQEITHAGLAREMTGLRFHADGAPGEATLAHVERQAERCPAQDAMVTACTTRVHYAFDVPAETVARMGRGAAPMPLAFSDTIGRTFHGAIHPAEVAGIAAVVETLQPDAAQLASVQLGAGETIR